MTFRDSKMTREQAIAMADAATRAIGRQQRIIEELQAQLAAWGAALEGALAVSDKSGEVTTGVTLVARAIVEQWKRRGGA